MGKIDAQQSAYLTKDEVLLSMRKATDYMALEVSNRGGYLYHYSEDFTEQWGENTARKSQIWVQEVAPQIGKLFLDLYENTGDEAYLNYAKRLGNALIFGQHELGGWNFFIDFDPRGIEEWYDQVASRYAVGMEEFRFYSDNCTYDDNITQGATAYLLRLYMITLAPEYLGPLQKALNFMLISQYPNGAWPQRYPLTFDHVQDTLPDYTSMYTLNDDAMKTIIDVLLDAYIQLGDERYLESAKRGGDFFMISQGPEGQAAWAEQFGMDMQPCWARTHEPAAFFPREVVNTIATLEKLYLFTGDRRYLRPVPGGLEWLKKSQLRLNEDGTSVLARYYEPGTNIPLNRTRKKEVSEEGYVLNHWFPDESKPFMGETRTVDLEEVVSTYERVRDAAPEEREDLYNELYVRNHKEYSRYFGGIPDQPVSPNEEEVSALINALNEQGAWIEPIEVLDSKPGEICTGKKTIQGISTLSYIKNMRVLMGFID